MRCIIAAVTLLATSPLLAQTGDVQNDRERRQEEAQRQDQADMAQTLSPPIGSTPIVTGHVATSSVGEAGRRQSNTPMLGMRPMARLETRIPNRVQNRIRNRIDRNYDPQANATSPFVTAEDKTRNAGRN